MKKVEENKTHWYNVKINDSTQCFIETLRKRILEDYDLNMTKDAVIRAILHQGMLVLNTELINEDPMSLFRQGE